MTFFIMLVLTRKSGLTPDQFRDYYIGSHLPMLRQLIGSHFPVRHIQRYIQRTDGPRKHDNTFRNRTTPATVLLGNQSDFDYDAIVTLEFADEAAYQAHYDFVRQRDIKTRITEDEKRFLDRLQTRTVVLGEIIEVTAQSTRSTPHSTLTYY
ncbi:EthD domain-containing protein [Xylaria flabelliformis]|nr:EthD domain-containing protein [Xylaria flabelliformis]